MAVDAIIEGAVVVQQGIAGVKRAHPNAPESLAELPCFVTVPEKGERAWPLKPNLRDTTHDLRMTLYVSRGDLPGADQALKPWIDTVIATFDQHLTLGGACLAAGVVSYEYGKVEYAGTDYLGISFVLRAREVTGVVYAG